MLLLLAGVQYNNVGACAGAWLLVRRLETRGHVAAQRCGIRDFFVTPPWVHMSYYRSVA